LYLPPRHKGTKQEIRLEIKRLKLFNVAKKE